MEHIDFLPERIRIQRARRRSLVRQAYLIGACTLALFILGYVRQGMISGAKGELLRLDDQVANVNSQLAMRHDLARQQADLMIKKRIDDRLGSRVYALEVLAELERTLPKSIFLVNLALEAVDVHEQVEPAEQDANQADSSGRTPRDKVVRRVRLALTGVAPSDVDLANFIAQMSSAPLFEDVSMGYAKNTEFRGRTVREFQASCYVVR